MQRRYKLNILIVSQTLLLLAVSLGTLFYFSHRALKQEAIRDAEHMLESTAYSIDNILLSVEQSTGNIYFDLVKHLDQPDRMFTYSRELVLSNPYIIGCAIAFKPGYYPGKDLFMAYVHHRAFANDVKSDLVVASSFTSRPYTEQSWFTDPLNKGYVTWTDPLKGDDTENEPLVKFCLPIFDDAGERVGVIAVDVALSQLSKIVLAVKPSERGYCMLLSKSGSLIVHPNVDLLQSETVFTKIVAGADPTYHDAIEAMLSGEKGMRNFQMEDESWSVFYKPFERADWKGRAFGKLGWSVGVVYPDSDIHSVHYTLLYAVILIAIACLLLFFFLGSRYVYHEFKPLRMLTAMAQRVADGHYDESVPDATRSDEIGRLQNRFRAMLDKLNAHSEELESEASQSYQEGDQLKADYGRLTENDRMKTSLLHYITNQMALPAENIDNNVTALCNNYRNLSKEEIDRRVNDIERKSETLLELLKHMAHFTETEGGKEAKNE